jgi:hypothetical protein
MIRNSFSYVHVLHSNSRAEVILPIEILFSMFYVALLAGSFVAIRFDRNKPSQIWLSACECVVVCVIFLDCAIATHTSDINGGVRYRFGVPARPILIVLWSSRMRQICVEVVDACRSLKYMVLLILGWLLLSSLFFVQTLRRICNFGDGNRPGNFQEGRKIECAFLMRHFDNSLVGVVSVFILITGEMYTVVLLPLLDIPGHAYDFIVVLIWSVVSYFILMAIVVAIVFNAYKDAKHSTFVTQSDSLDKCLMDAFELIADPEKFTINFSVYARFLECFQVYFPCPRSPYFLAHYILQPGINSKTIRLYWGNHNKTKVGVFRMCNN